MNDSVSKKLDDLLVAVGCDAYPRTIAGVVMWLYDTHGIWISVGNVPFEKEFMFEYSICDVTQLLRMDGVFESPEKAYEAALMYILEKLRK